MKVVVVLQKEPDRKLPFHYFWYFTGNKSPIKMASKFNRDLSLFHPTISRSLLVLGGNYLLHTCRIKRWNLHFEIKNVHNNKGLSMSSTRMLGSIVSRLTLLTAWCVPYTWKFSQWVKKILTWIWKELKMASKNANKVNILRGVKKPQNNKKKFQQQNAQNCKSRNHVFFCVFLGRGGGSTDRQTLWHGSWDLDSPSLRGKARGLYKCSVEKTGAEKRVLFALCSKLWPMKGPSKMEFWTSLPSSFDWIRWNVIFEFFYVYWNAYQLHSYF